jgi:small subunit ribosomal protein S7
VPRKGNTPKRTVLPDPVYNDIKVSKLINNIMLDGKKGVAQKITYDALTSSKSVQTKSLLMFSTRLLRMLCLLSSAKHVV